MAAEDPEVGVILHLGSGQDPHDLQEAISCDPRGLVFKSSDPAELFEAITAVSAGERHVTGDTEDFIARAARPRRKVLSAREGEVLQLLADGLNGVEVSVELRISPETVKTHIRNAMRKLRAVTRVHAVTKAIARGEVRAWPR